MPIASIASENVGKFWLSIGFVWSVRCIMGCDTDETILLIILIFIYRKEQVHTQNAKITYTPGPHKKKVFFSQNQACLVQCGLNR